MPYYRRLYIPNAIIFITCITRKRCLYLKSKSDLDLFFGTLEKVMDLHPFELLAYVVLPDHFHWLIKSDHPSENFSKIMHSIKRNFTLNYKHTHNLQHPLILWQRGFWDHVIRNEHDFRTHLDYIHWNPIKHGYVTKPEDWPYSSFKDWVNEGVYEQGWGWAEEPPNISELNFE